MCCWHTVCRAPASEPPCSETNGRRVDASVDYCKARGRQAHEYTSNTAPEKTVVLYTMDASNEMVRIILEPDEKMLEALRAGVPKAADRMDE